MSLTTLNKTSAPNEFPDPFLDIASFMMPNSFKDMLDMCTVLWLKNGTYRQAIQRIVRYFITQPEFNSDSEEERKELSNFLSGPFNLNNEASLVGDDLLVYGVSFSSIIYPFNRFLRCQKCKRETFIDNTNWSYSAGDFTATCGCGYKGKHTVIDRKSFDKERIVQQRWSPYDINLREHPYSRRKEVYWNIPVDLSSRVKAGEKFIIRDLPVEILTTIKQNNSFKFSPEFIHCMSEDTLSGINSKGWGLPRLISNFAQAYYVQLLKRSSEALAQDYIVPFRMISPAVNGQKSSSMGNPWVGGLDVEMYNRHLSTMIQEHRKDPTKWGVAPFPVQYQSLSGEGNMAAPQLLEQGVNEMLSAAGIPPELYTGSVTTQAAPMALRVLQQSWPTLVGFLNGWLKFCTTGITNYMNWTTPEDIKFKTVTLADDLERRQLLLQLASANLVSKNTAFGVWGLDPQEEQDKILEEMKSEQESQMEFQQDMEQRAQTSAMLQQSDVMGMAGPGAAPGMMGPGGAGMMGAPAAGGGGATPMDSVNQAQQLAQQLVSMPYEARRSEMSNLKKSDPVLHSLVKTQMEDIRNQVKTQASMSLSQGQM